MGSWSAEPSRTAVRAAIGTTVLDARNATGGAVGRALRATVCAAVCSAVCSAVRAAVGPTIRAPVGPTIGATVLHSRHALSAAVRRTFEVIDSVAGSVGWFAHRSSVE
jgi:hypothetical protein